MAPKKKRLRITAAARRVARRATIRELKRTIARLQRSHAQKRLVRLVDLMERWERLHHPEFARLKALAELRETWREIRAELVAGR
jgi:ribosomal protein L29